MSQLRALLVLWCFGLGVAVAGAQPVELPNELPALASSLSEGETMIDAESVDQFSAIVLPALEHVVKRGGMPLPAIQDLPFSDHSDLLWAIQGTKAGRANPFPFPAVREEGESDQALHLMKNGEALWQNPPAFEASVSYHRYRDGYEPSLLHFNLIRSSTTPQQPYPAGQLFRELVSLDAPAGIAPLQYLSIRFSDAMKDRLWEQSGPGGVRSLEPWLRHERAAGGLFVLDDLFVHAASPFAYEYREVHAATLLVPFSGVTQPAVVEDGDGCITMTQDRQTPHFNSFSKRFARASGWVPTEMVFVPRRVFLITAVPKSPYPTEAEITVVVDRETMLPVMKVVRSDSGSLVRVVLGGTTLVRTKGGLIVPFIRHLVSITGGAREVDALSFDEIRRCGVERAIALRVQLDTTHLLKAAESSGGGKEEREAAKGSEPNHAEAGKEREAQPTQKAATVSNATRSPSSPKKSSRPQERSRSQGTDEEGVEEGID